MFDSEQLYIITGASSGIGAEVVKLLNEQGASVVAIARNENRLNVVKNSCKTPNNVYLEIKDLSTDVENLPKYVKELKDKYGKFSGLVHCAGIIDFMPLRVLELDSLKKIFDINYYVPIMLTKGFADKRNNTGEGASIVFVSSISAETCDKSMLGYVSSKAALKSAAKVISRELISQKIRVNTILPSDIETNMTKSVEELREKRSEKYPWGLGKPEDVANMISFLLSDKSKWITGQNYIIDCGSV